MRWVSRDYRDCRISPRFVPEDSVSATILDGDFHVVHGIVANLSESGASLVTNRCVGCGPDIEVKLTQNNHGVFNSRAKVVWKSQGKARTKDVVGVLLGVSFLEVSERQRKKMRHFLLSHDDHSVWHIHPAGSERVEFDLIIDPQIDKLFSEEPVDVDRELKDIRARIEPYLPNGERHSGDGSASDSF